MLDKNRIKLRLKAYAECSEILGAYTESNCAYDAIRYIEELEYRVTHAEVILDMWEALHGLSR
jgi:hypothetical protein